MNRNGKLKSYLAYAKQETASGPPLGGNPQRVEIPTGALQQKLKRALASNARVLLEAQADPG